jgi:triosephosphate isomerase
MNKSVQETELLCHEILKAMPNMTNTEIVVCPPFTSLGISVSILSKKIQLRAQNLYFQLSDAFTGEISPGMIRDRGARYVILDHNQYYSIFNESNQFLNAKIISALEHNLIPILWVGETEKELESNRTAQIITTQLKESLDGIANYNIVLETNQFGPLEQEKLPCQI